MAKKIGVIGSGQVAQVLARGFVKYGYDVMIGSRTKEKLETWKQKNQVTVKVGNFEDAAAFGELLVLAIKGSVAENLVRSLSEKLKGKTVIDTTNPIADSPPQNGVVQFSTDLNMSLMEKLQKAAPDANFVKAFNSVGNSRMVDPSFREGKPTMFICGNSAQSKNDVAKILEEFGWDVCDMGSEVAARAIEPLCILWCIPGFLRNEWNHAFKLLRT
jgi:8-hydroxy-5-deazaflavin:NADPH oxidoreductase